MARLVAIPGSGDWFRGGLVAYDEQVKVDLLGVPPGPVVTGPSALRMARGIRLLLGTDWGISTTGEAGPETSEPVPVGTLFVGLAGPDASVVHHDILSGGPDEIRQSAAGVALSMILDRVALGFR